MSFLNALDREIADTEADIAAHPDPRVVKLAELRRLRAEHYARNPPAYVSTPNANTSVVSGTNSVVPKSILMGTAGNGVHTHQFLSAGRRAVQEDIFISGDSETRPPGRKRSPEREKALQSAQDYLVGKTEPVKTAEIFDYLAHLGIEVGGVDPKSNLSAMLNNSMVFKSHGRAGWTLS